MNLRIAARSCQGRREQNEDRIVCLPGKRLFGVIDGVGGEAGGGAAADIAAITLEGRLSRADCDAETALREAFALTTRAIAAHAWANPAQARAACVMTAIVVDEDLVTVGHAGNTRLYRITNAGMTQLTRDHTPVADLVRSGQLAPGEAARHPRKHEVNRVLAAEPGDPDDANLMDCLEVEMPRDGALLLTTDGIDDALNSEQIMAIIRRNAGQPERVVEELIGMAIRNGSQDNASAVYLETESFGQCWESGAAVPKFAQLPGGGSSAAGVFFFAFLIFAFAGTVILWRLVHLQS